VAVVDAMGTTQDTKLPSVFRTTDMQTQLFTIGRAKLKSDAVFGPLRKELETLQKSAGLEPIQKQRMKDLERRIGNEDAILKQIETACKTEMLRILDGDRTMPDALKERYKRAIQVDFNAFGTTNIMPQFAGKITEVEAISVSAGGHGSPYKIGLEMEVSLAEKYAQAIGGTLDVTVQDRFKAFNKMAEDITPRGQQSLGAQIDDALYVRGSANPNDTRQYTTSTPLIDFTFRRSQADTDLLLMHLDI
jgi:hypothetical protein